MRNRFIGIDKARAFAALSVVLTHIIYANVTAKTPGIVKEFAPYLFTGIPPVIAFFVISGFCIHYPYTNRPLPFWQFWLARWTRISIPLVVALVFAKLAGVPRFNFWDGFILWSIVCELIYYTLYPVFFIISRFISWKTQFYLAFVMSLTLVVMMGTNQQGLSNIYGPYLNWLVALPSWLAGCVLAEKINTQKLQSTLITLICWRILIAFAASLLTWLTLNTVFGYYLTLNVFSMLVFFWLSAEISVEQQASSLFEGVGRWSYSLYLFHMIIYFFLVRLYKLLDISNHVVQIFERLLAFPLVLFGCYLVYLLVEKKSHQYARFLYAKYSGLTQWSLIHRN